MLFTEAGGAGGAAGGGRNEPAPVGGEGFGTLLTSVGAWFRFWLSFCAREADDIAGLPPKAVFGATAGPLAVEFGAAV